MTGLKLAIEQFKKHKIPYIRPEDHYAEMLKTDGNKIHIIKQYIMFLYIHTDHMRRVRERLLEDKQKIDVKSLFRVCTRYM